MAAQWKLLILITLVGGAAWQNRPAMAARATMAAQQDLGISGDGLGALSVPVDPVIEEPLRPLYPVGDSLSFESTTGCGSMRLFTPMLILLLLVTTRLSPRYWHC